jgi:hypothetical protein
MTETLSGDETVTEPQSGSEPEAGEEAGPLGQGSPVGVRLVPQRTPGLTVGVLPRSYQDIVEVLADAVHPMRAHHL